MVRIVSIEANIGAGKSTFINKLKELVGSNPRFMLIPEPVDKWLTIKGSCGKNCLDIFYSDQKSNALPFQLIALLTRRNIILEMIEEAKKIEAKLELEKKNEIRELLSQQTSEFETENDEFRESKNQKLFELQNKRTDVILITERTVFSDKYIFASLHHDEGNINDLGMVAYNMWNDLFSSESKVNKILYIITPPKVCLERIKNRNREGEDKILIEYIEKVHNAHVNFFNEVISKKDHMIIDLEHHHYNDDEYLTLVKSVIEYFQS